MTAPSMTGVASKLRPDVWIMPGWPHGFCPVHCLEEARCGVWCVSARVAFAVAAHDLEEYWRTHAVHTRWAQLYESPLERSLNQHG